MIYLKGEQQKKILIYEFINSTEHDEITWMYLEPQLYAPSARVLFDVLIYSTATTETHTIIITVEDK